MARENSGWGYDRIVGALAHLGHHVSDQTVGNVLRRHSIQPAPQRSQNTTWREFIESHLAVLAGIDFFTVEVLTWRGLVTYYVLFSSTWRAGASAGRGSRGIQGKGNVLLFPSEESRRRRSVSCRERLRGLLKYYGRAA